jgi:hypothetical protein
MSSGQQISTKFEHEYCSVKGRLGSSRCRVQVHAYPGEKVMFSVAVSVPFVQWEEDQTVTGSEMVGFSRAL